MTLDKAAVARGRTELPGPVRTRRQQRHFDKLLRRAVYRWYGAPREKAADPTLVAAVVAVLDAPK
jgi:hypothetical protein